MKKSINILSTIKLILKSKESRVWFYNVYKTHLNAINLILAIGGIIVSIIDINDSWVYRICIIVALITLFIVPIFTSVFNAKLIINEHKIILKNNLSVTISIHNDFVENSYIEKHKEAAVAWGMTNEFNLKACGPKSLQYEFLEKYYNNDEKLLGNLQQEIDNQLSGSKYGSEVLESESGKRIKYKIGTAIIVPLTQCGAEKYPRARKLILIACSQVQKDKKFICMGDGDPTCAYLENLWNLLETNSIHINSLIIPLIGSGVSETVSPFESITAIINHHFKHFTNGRNMIRNLIISIRPECIQDAKSTRYIDLLKLYKYIELKNLELDYKQ